MNCNIQHILDEENFRLICITSHQVEPMTLKFRTSVSKTEQFINDSNVINYDILRDA